MHRRKSNEQQMVVEFGRQVCLSGDGQASKDKLKIEHDGLCASHFVKRTYYIE